MHIANNVTFIQFNAYQRPSAAPPAALPERPCCATKEEVRLNGLLNDWGSDESPYDLNANGTVDVDDLLALINGSGGSAPLALPAPPDENPPVPPLASPPAGTGAAPASGGLTTTNNIEPSLDGLMADWGKSNSPYDFNNDGTVDTDDLLAFINHTPAKPAPPPPGEPNESAGQASAPPVIDEPVSPSLEEAPRLAQRRDIRGLADAMIRRLIAAGYDRQPPTNLREAVDRLDLTRRESTAMFQHLAHNYPHGLGVNVRG